MIKDCIERAEKYYKISDNLRQGFEWIKNNDLLNMKDGRYIISDFLYANVQTYDTKEDAPYEAHRQYIDIQCMINGEELSGVTDYKNCSTVTAYDETKDIEFLKNNAEENFYKIKTGEFFVFFPHDAHKPALKVNEISNVKKVIVKVKI